MIRIEKNKVVHNGVAKGIEINGNPTGVIYGNEVLGVGQGIKISS